jgi:Leucine-rich repeat (LRR) protein
MTSLRTLYVGNNKLQALPPALCALPNLTLK